MEIFKGELYNDKTNVYNEYYPNDSIIQSKSVDEQENKTEEKLWCICREPYDDDMIEGDECDEGYHPICINMSEMEFQYHVQFDDHWICLFNGL